MRLLKLLSAAHVLAQAIHLQTTLSVSVIQHVTSLTVKVPKLQSGQISSVALMDARSIAATAANKGYLTAATDIDVNYSKPKYYFDKNIYANRVFDSKGVADPSVEIKFGCKYQRLAKDGSTDREPCTEGCF